MTKTQESKAGLLTFSILAWPFVVVLIIEVVLPGFTSWFSTIVALVAEYFVIRHFEKKYYGVGYDLTKSKAGWLIISTMLWPLVSIVVIGIILIAMQVPESVYWLIIWVVMISTIYFVIKYFESEHYGVGVATEQQRVQESSEPETAAETKEVSNDSTTQTN